MFSKKAAGGGCTSRDDKGAGIRFQTATPGDIGSSRLGGARVETAIHGIQKIFFSLRTAQNTTDRVATILDNPWIAIWMSPRETIREIVDRDPTYRVIMLGALAGALTTLNSMLAATLGFTPIPLPASLVPFLPILTFASPFLGAAFGILGLYTTALVMDWSGRALGGVGNALTVRAAVAWSGVPQICLSIVTLLILLGAGVWQALVPSMPAPNVSVEAAANPFTLTNGVEAIISIWSFILMLLCVGEVHRFSAWRTLSAFLLPGVILGAIAIVLKIALT
jgi:Yip1 domain